MFFDLKKFRPEKYHPRETDVQWARAIGLRRWGLTVLWWLIALLAVSVWVCADYVAQSDIADASIQAA